MSVPPQPVADLQHIEQIHTNAETTLATVYGRLASIDKLLQWPGAPPPQFRDLIKSADTELDSALQYLKESSAAIDRNAPPFERGTTTLSAEILQRWQRVKERQGQMEKRVEELRKRLAGIQPRPPAASFDCTKATTNVERTICSDSELSVLDGRMAEVYQQAISVSPYKDLLSEQRDWLKNHRNMCTTVECLRVAYQDRIAVLENILENRGQSDKTIPDTQPSSEEAEQLIRLVREYYEAVGRRNVDAALGKWKSRPNNIIALIKNTDYTEVKAVSVETVEVNRAIVWVDVVVKARDRLVPEYWQGNIELEPMNSGQWGIVRMPLSRVAGAGPTVAEGRGPAVVPSYDEPVTVVRAYYAALDRRDVAVALSMRKSPPKDFDALVKKIEYFKVNDARVDSEPGNRANVWVDVLGKRFGASPERWQGPIELEEDSGRWVIVSLGKLQKVR